MSKTNSETTIDWQSELTRIATKHHIIVCWVAIILNPIWFVADYFTIPDHWINFLVVRLAVTFITLLAVIFQKKLNISSEVLIFIPVLGISIQNAYMWSVMDIPMLQKHTFAYIALFIGAGMLVLWKPWWSITVVLLSLIGNIIFFNLLSNLTIDEILINGGFLTGTVAIITIVLIHSRYSLTKKEIIARLTLAESNKELEIKNEIIEEKNKDIRDSINYAQGIQQAILPDRDELQKVLPESFVLFQPKDIVSGDFYWFEIKKDSILIAAADCTGHGVPGALMSMIGNTFLHEIVNEKNISKASEILEILRERIIKTMKKRSDGAESKDGMDIALISLKLKIENLKLENAEQKIPKLEYAGAFNPLWIIRDKKLIEIKADKFPVGAHISRSLENFTNNEIELQKGDAIYIFTDGYADQFGGPAGKKFKYKQLLELLLSIQDKGMEEQKNILNITIEKWKGALEQVDDICVIGVRV